MKVQTILEGGESHLVLICTLQEGLEILGREHVDIAFVDILCWGLDKGIELENSAQFLNPDLDVVIMTRGDAFEQVFNISLRLGVQTILLPLSLDDLMDCLHRAAQKKKTGVCNLDKKYGVERIKSI